MAQSRISFSKSRLFKICTTAIIILFISSGIVSVAEDDIKSATRNFSAMGLVSEISEDGLSVSDAKGSDGSGKTGYDFNIDHIEKMETNTNIPLNFSDIKEGDKIIVQGLTNGNTFFAKRIISFTSTPTPVVPEEENATTTATSTVSEEISTTTATSTIDERATSTVISTSTESTESAITTTATSTTEAGATTTATSTQTLIENAVDIIESVAETVTSVVEEMVETIANSEPVPAETVE